MPPHLATVWETFHTLEWVIVAVPVVFHLCRYLGLSAVVKPELWGVLGLVLVLALARREKLRGIGAKEMAQEAKQRGREQTVLDKVVFHFTSPQCGTDRHRPVRSFVKGASCFCFALPAIDLYFFQPAENYEIFHHEVWLLGGQCIFAYMADHVMCGIPSYWHPADRCWAFGLTAYGLAKPFLFALNYEDTFASWVAVSQIFVFFPGVSRRHHGLPTHHVQHALFHVVACAAWNYASLSYSHDLLGLEPY